MSTASVALGELTKIRTGKLDANAANENGAYPFFTCAVEPLLINTAAFDCKAVLVAGNGDLNVKYYEGKFNAYQRTYVIESLDESKLLPKYLYFFLDKYVEKLREQAIGGVIKYIKLGNLTEANIPLPPLAEQKSIAAILDKAAEIKAKREQAIAKLDELAHSTFVEMFGDVKNNVHSFVKKQLGDLIKLSSGDFLPASNMQENGQYAVYGGNGINGYHDAYMFEERRIVIGRVGAYCGCVHITNEKAWITDNALYVDVKDKDLDFDYLAYALMMANLNSVSSKSGQPLVSGSRIYPVEILQPPLPLQRKFAKAKAKIDALKSDELRGMDYVIKLTASLQHQAFTTGFSA